LEKSGTESSSSTSSFLSSVFFLSVSFFVSSVFLLSSSLSLILSINSAFLPRLSRPLSWQSCFSSATFKDSKSAGDEEEEEDATEEVERVNRDVAAFF
jgi:hypothetical protein